ncbi:nuclear pore complex protein Nup50-like [Stegodyphus dumicola]|uniref:nuclear pore complex protein Nup50-like n=1 Tax=Stegodyphus dumicola TaxID=202533 RepID=UPI0015B35DF1|nr:nuclear pore complex protein Nup50-like [Stegodyphus dumicola]
MSAFSIFASPTWPLISHTSSLLETPPVVASILDKLSGTEAISSSTEEQEYVPPKNEVVAVTEEGAVYSKRCKLFFKKDDSYAEKGIGTVYLKPIDGKTQLLIRADTNLGNILLNIMLSSSLPMSRTGKNNVLIVCIPNPPVDIKNPDSKEAIPILIRVKTSEDADELLENLNKYKS